MVSNSAYFSRLGSHGLDFDFSRFATRNGKPRGTRSGRQTIATASSLRLDGTIEVIVFDSSYGWYRFLSRPTWLADGLGPKKAPCPRGQFTPIVGSPAVDFSTFGLGIGRHKLRPMVIIHTLLRNVFAF